VRLPWELPLMQAPIGPATTTELVASVSATGALGTLAASWTTPAKLRDQIREIRSATSKPFCVNLVLAFDQRERLELALAEGVPVLSLSWGADAELIGRARANGAFVLVQVSDSEAAKAAAAAGASSLIAQGVEAGGHVQGTTPLSTLLREVTAAVSLPVLAAGGIADTAGARAALDAGAQAVACGTAFLAAAEADVHSHYRDRLLAAGAGDTQLTGLFDIGWRDAPHRVVRNRTIAEWEAAGGPPAGRRPGEGDVVATRGRTPIVRYSDAQPTASTQGDVESMAMYAGTGVGALRRVAPAAAIVDAIAGGSGRR
jgi:NAD(P)H-dependent flavin oxidoreductase YrpB (nitropropane dioxygenase family)